MEHTRHIQTSTSTRAAVIDTPAVMEARSNPAAENIVVRFLIRCKS